jgi:hypothetical protein
MLPVSTICYDIPAKNEALNWLTICVENKLMRLRLFRLSIFVCELFLTNYICIGNSMVLSAIWGKHTRVDQN